MNALHTSILLILAATGVGVVATRDPLRQSVAASLYGLLLAIFFLILQAPDVALSELVVGMVIFPLMVMAALAKVSGKGAQ